MQSPPAGPRRTLTATPRRIISGPPEISPLLEQEPSAERAWILRDGRVFCIAAMIATFLVWLPSVMNDFVLADDQTLIVLNPRMNPPSWSNVGWYLTHPMMHIYQPLAAALWSGLASLSWTDQSALTGHHINPAVFHLASVLL